MYSYQNITRAKSLAAKRELNRERLRRAASKSLLGFILFLHPNFKVSWHHRLLCKKLDDVIAGRTKRLIVSMPPRHGKSEIISRYFPAYYLGKFPDKEYMAASYAEDLASAMNRDVQRIMDTPEYRSVFPDVVIPADGIANPQGKLRNASLFEILNKRGKYQCAGVGGAMTGKGAHALVIDDPLKNWEEASSKTIRTGIINWFDSTANTRLAPNAPVVVVATRWHAEDLSGTLLTRAEHDPDVDQWEELCLPAIKDGDSHAEDLRQDGEALWPQRYPIERLKKIRAANTLVWSALFQQRPTAKEGEFVKREHIRYWHVRPQKFDEEILSMDCAFKDTEGSDNVVIHHWGRVNANRYLLNKWKAKIDFDGTLKMLSGAIDETPQAYSRIVEDKANGTAVINVLRKKYTGLIPFNPQASKSARLSIVLPQIVGGNVLFPDPEIYVWARDTIEEILAFPKGKHDDEVDAMTQALLHFEESAGNYLDKLLTM